MDEMKHDFDEQIYDNHFVRDLAEIGTAAGLYIRVFTNEVKCPPHFHYTSIDGSIDGCIRLDRVEYFSHGTQIVELDRPRIRQLIAFLKAKSKAFKYGLTNWELLCGIWDSGDSTIKVDKIGMPDYTILEFDSDTFMRTCLRKKRTGIYGEIWLYDGADKKNNSRDKYKVKYENADISVYIQFATEEPVVMGNYNHTELTELPNVIKWVKQNRNALIALYDGADDYDIRDFFTDMRST